MKENTAKNFVVQLGSLIALYVSLSALLVLIFGIINLRFPDEAAYYFADEGARESIRFSIATLIVFFPTYLVLTRIANQTRRKEDSGNYTVLAKWLVYLSLLVGGGIVLGDLVTILLYLLDGEITTRFALKAFALLAVVGVTFSYYLLDVRGYFKNREKLSIQYGAGAAVLVVAVLVFGFFHIETPAEVREMKLDDQQVTDLQDIQWRIEEHYQVQNVLPQSINEVYDGIPVPEAPEGRASYEYSITGADTYELCATFVHPSTKDSQYRSITSPFEKGNYNWEHGEGEVCFPRTVEVPR